MQETDVVDKGQTYVPAGEMEILEDAPNLLRIGKPRWPPCGVLLFSVLLIAVGVLFGAFAVDARKSSLLLAVCLFVPACAFVFGAFLQSFIPGDELRFDRASNKLIVIERFMFRRKAKYRYYELAEIAGVGIHEKTEYTSWRGHRSGEYRSCQVVLRLRSGKCWLLQSSQDSKAATRFAESIARFLNSQDIQQG